MRTWPSSPSACRPWFACLLAGLSVAAVAWVPALSLWIMTCDGGRQSLGDRHTKGIYLTYAQSP